MLNDRNFNLSMEIVMNIRESFKNKINVSRQKRKKIQMPLCKVCSQVAC